MVCCGVVVVEVQGSSSIVKMVLKIIGKFLNLTTKYYQTKHPNNNKNKHKHTQHTNSFQYNGERGCFDWLVGMRSGPPACWGHKDGHMLLQSGRSLCGRGGGDLLECVR